VLHDRIAALDPAAAATLAPESAPAAEDEVYLELVDPDTGITVSEEAPGDSAGADTAGDSIDLEIDMPGAAQAHEGEPDPDSSGFEIEVDVDADSFGDDADPLVLEPGVAETTQRGPAPGDDLSDDPALVSLGESTSQHIAEELEEAEFYRQQALYDEAEALYERVLERAPNHPVALLRLGEIAAARGGDPGSTGPQTPAAESPVLEIPPAPEDEDLAEIDDADLAGLDLDLEDAAELADSLEGEPAPGDTANILSDAAASSTGEELAGMSSDDGIAAAEEYLDVSEQDAIASGSLADLADSLDGELADSVDGDLSDPAHEEFADAIDEDLTDPLAADAGDWTDPAGHAAPSFPAGEAAGFDLAAELSDALDDDAESSGGGSASADDGFAAVFGEFKKGVSEALDASDHEAHYDLGIAYREMGLLEDATAEFRQAMRSAERRIDSLHMLGLCALEADRVGEAREFLEHALASQDVSREQELAIRFELGRAHDRAGDLVAARDAWERVAAIDPGFCEVEDVLAELDERAKADEGGGEASAAFESFDDLVEEAASPANGSEAEQHESFDDLIAQVNAELDAEEALALGEDDAAPERPAPAPRSEPTVGNGAGAAPAAGRRRKKISFV
jgi:tetratricopeptide (TPR) repeat protein